MKLNIPVILGSVRKNRQGIKVAKFVISELKIRGHNPILIDPLKYKLSLLNKRFSDYPKSKAPASLKKLSTIFKKADAVLVVSAEYNHSIPPALSNLIDHFYKEYLWKPSGIVSYSIGSFAGVRASMQLRSLLSAVGMPAISTIFSIPKVHETFDLKGNPKEKDYSKRIKQFMDELEWYAHACKAQRKKGVPY